MTTVTVSTLQQTLARAPGGHGRGRLERAATQVVLAAVTRVAEHEYIVGSQTAAGVTYVVTPDGCGCADRKRHPSQRCKHDLAVRLLLQAEIDERRADDERRTRFPLLFDDEMARLATLKNRAVTA
jgi:hypothetical protein